MPRLVKRLKNDGVWRKTTVTARGLPDSIEFQLSELRLLEDNSLRFSIECSLPVLVRNEKQRWENGVQIYGGSTEARMSLYLRATCDARRMIGRSEEGKPEIVIKMDVIEANVDYGDLEWQKVAGVAGDGGELLGKGLQSIVEDIFPKLKRKLIAKARRAVFKAADDKEFRIKISSLFGQ